MLPKTAKGDRTRTSLIEKAAIRFARDGFNQTNLSEIARDVGIKPASIYAYFEDKRDLFFAALNLDNASLFNKIDEEILDDFSQDWNLSFEKILDLIELHPLTKRVLMGGEEMASARLEVLPSEALLIEKLVAKIKSGQVHKIIRSDIDPDLI
ncbi:MAG: TetR/AcrR family transcriptional regulator, partial [Acidimicrobiales bacterium]|nr:TetR/AcrR family transcriptional regulator [Acidimicrobiales bacterium]